MTDVTGHKAIERRLKLLEKKMQKKILRKGMSASQKIIKKEIRSQIPPTQKSIRKTVASSFKKNKYKGVQEARVGLGIGKQKKPQRDPGRPGVGISKRNVHWWVLGTKGRRTKSGRYTGRMPKGPPVVKRAYAASESQAEQAMKTEILIGIADALRSL